MQNLWLAKQFTAILVTHELREAALLADRVVVFSPRPGHIIYEAEVPFPRPRSLDTTYTAEFVELVHQLREKIWPGQQA